MAKRSKITQLPKAMQEWFEETLIARNFQRYEAMVLEMRALGEKLGVPPADLPGKSALQRAGSALESRLLAIKDATHAAVLINKQSPDDAGMLGGATMSLIQTGFFNVMVTLKELEGLGADADPAKRVALLAKAAKAVSELSRAGVSQKKWELVLRDKLQTAADAVAKIGKKGGLSKAGADEIRKMILGIAN